jgi:hypothetical protein
MRFAGSVSFRPVRIGFLIPPDNLGLVSRVAQLSTCLWGGRYNVMIPFFEAGGQRWVPPYQNEGGLNVARGYVNFFEPDTLVESSPGMAERLGWHSENWTFGLPRVVSLGQFYERNIRGRVEFVGGVDILEVMQHLYDDGYKYERRHKRPFAVVDNVDGNAFFDVVGGRYPSDEALADIPRAYVQVFSAETLPASSDTAMKFFKEGYAGPLWIVRHGLEESLGRGFHSESFYVFDPTDAGDVIDYWNYRLIAGRVIPINLEWFVHHKDFIREHILRVHRPIPGNPSGTKFHTAVKFASSISDATANELMRKHLDGLPDTSFFLSRDPLVWQKIGRGRRRRETKILATSKAISFDEEIGPEGYVRLPAPSPTFLNVTGRYTEERWVNVIMPTRSTRGDDPAIVYPSNLWAPDFPRLGASENLRIGREGWVLQQEHTIGYSLLRPQDGREAITSWLKTQGIEAQPSEEGQVAAQVIAAAGGLRAVGMFADRKTIDLLSEMAESRVDLCRSGKRVATTTPDRSKHINTVRQHFDERSKRSFGYWNGLDYFLKRSVFRAGLRVQCPVCAYRNWFDLDAISYSPTCTRCLNQFEFLQTPEHLHDVNWFYRVVGPFAAPDYARGGYAVALTLRCIAGGFHDSEMTWTTGLKLQPMNSELDFAAWHRPERMLNEERDEPLLVIGEAKSFGKNAIGEDDVSHLRSVANCFPGAIMIVSSLREISDYTADELQRLRDLALWGRREIYQGQPRNPLVILTATELFANHGIFDAWKKTGEAGQTVHASIDPADLHALAELTQKRYLDLPGFWEEWMKAHDLAHQRRRLLKLIERRATP